VLRLLGCDLRDSVAVLDRVGGRLRLAIDFLAKRNPPSLDRMKDSGP
jgi:hypothetical protein